MEVAFLDTQLVAVSDSKDQHADVLFFTATEWKAFLAGVRRGEFDLGRS